MSYEESRMGRGTAERGLYARNKRKACRALQNITCKLYCRMSVAHLTETFSLAGADELQRRERPEKDESPLDLQAMSFVPRQRPGSAPANYDGQQQPFHLRSQPLGGRLQYGPEQGGHVRERKHHNAPQPRLRMSC